MKNNEPYWIAIQTSVVPYAIGEPGTCKTRSVEAFAKAMGYDPCWSMSLSQYEPTDVGGYPAPRSDDTGEFVRMVLPEFMHSCQKAKKALLFVDELTTCSPATQAAALRTMTHGLGDNVKICAAGNPPECAANGYPLTAPMSNRLFHYTWNNDWETWSEGFMAGFPERSYPTLKKGWERHIMEAKIFIRAFLQRFHKHFHRMPKEEDKRSNPWPSARSWTNAAELLGAGISLGYEFSIDSGNVHPIQSAFLVGTVGNETANDFFTWKNSLDLPDPEELLKNPRKFKLPERNDSQMVLFGTLSSAVIMNPSKERYEAYWDIIGQAFAKKAGGNVIFGTRMVRDSKQNPDNKTAIACLPKDLSDKLFNTAKHLKGIPS